MANDLIRPEWDHAVDEETFGKIYKFGHIVAVRAGLVMTSEDNGYEILAVENRDGKEIQLPSNWSSFLEFTGGWSVPGMFKFTYQGEQMLERYKEIQKWEKANAKDRREYERLKAKFETDLS